MENTKFITIPELAKMMGVSRITVYNRVKRGEIKAIKIGKNYAISLTEVAGILGRELTEQTKKEIDQAVIKTVAEYGEVLKLLGQE